MNSSFPLETVNLLSTAADCCACLRRERNNKFRSLQYLAS